MRSWMRILALLLCIVLLSEMPPPSGYENARAESIRPTPSCLAPGSLFSGLEQAALSEILEIGSFLYEHRGTLSNQELIQQAATRFPDWFNSPSRAIWIYFDHVERPTPETLLIPFCAGEKRYKALFTTPDAHHPAPLIPTIEELDEIPRLSHAELQPAKANIFGKFTKYATAWAVTFAPPVISREECTPSGVQLVSGPGLSQFWQNKWWGWIQNTLREMEEAHIKVHEIRVDRSTVLQSLAGFSPVHLRIIVDAGLLNEPRPVTLDYYVDHSIAGGRIMDPILSTIRAAGTLPAHVFPLKALHAYGTPRFDDRQANQIYWKTADLTGPVDVLRTLHLYSEFFRLRLHPAGSKIPGEEDLIALLLYRVRFYAGLSVPDRQDLLAQLRRSPSNLDRLTRQVISTLQASPTLLQGGVNTSSLRKIVERTLLCLESGTTRRHSQLKKESPKLAERITGLSKRERRGLIDRLLVRCQELEAWQALLVAEAKAHWEHIRPPPAAIETKTAARKEMEWQTLARKTLKAAVKDLSAKYTRVRETVAQRNQRLKEATSQMLKNRRQRTLARYSDTELRELAGKRGVKLDTPVPALPPGQTSMASAPSADEPQNGELTQEVVISELLGGFKTLFFYTFMLVAAYTVAVLPWYAPLTTKFFLYAVPAIIADYLALGMTKRKKIKTNTMLYVLPWILEPLNAAFTIGAYAFLSSSPFMAPFHAWWTRLLFTNLVSSTRGEIYKGIRRWALKLQLDRKQVLEEELARRTFRQPQETLVLVLSDIERRYKEEREKREQEDQETGKKYNAVWWQARSFSEIKHIVVAMAPDPVFWDSLITPFFTWLYTWGSQLRNYLVDESAVRKGRLYLMVYPYIALWSRVTQEPGQPHLALTFDESAHSPQATALYTELQDPDPHVRAQAALELGRLGYGPACQALLVLAQEDPYPGVRVNAVKALGEIPTPRAIRALERILRTESTGYRTAAQDALENLLKLLSERKARVKKKKAMDALIRMLGHHRLGPRVSDFIVNTGSQAIPDLLRNQKPWPFAGTTHQREIQRLLLLLGDGPSVRKALQTVHPDPALVLTLTACAQRREISPEMRREIRGWLASVFSYAFGRAGAAEYLRLMLWPGGKKLRIAVLEARLMIGDFPDLDGPSCLAALLPGAAGQSNQYDPAATVLSAKFRKSVHTQGEIARCIAERPTCAALMEQTLMNPSDFVALLPAALHSRNPEVRAFAWYTLTELPAAWHVSEQAGHLAQYKNFTAVAGDLWAAVTKKHYTSILKILAKVQDPRDAMLLVQGIAQGDFLSKVREAVLTGGSAETRRLRIKFEEWMPLAQTDQSKAAQRIARDISADASLFLIAWAVRDSASTQQVLRDILKKTIETFSKQAYTQAKIKPLAGDLESSSAETATAAAL